MRDETTSRVMAADRPYGELSDFHSISSKYFGYALVLSSDLSYIVRMPTIVSAYVYAVAPLHCRYFHNHARSGFS
jgi:amino acid permease